MSKAAETVKKLIKECLPSYTLISEHYVNLGNNQLFFDFFIPELKLLVEVQGDQHDKFNKFFHKDIDEFNKAKARDNLKQEWASDNNLKLVYFYYNEIDSLTVETVIDRITTK